MRQSPGSNSPLVTRGSDQFPTYDLAVLVKKKFLPLEATLRSTSRGRNLFFITPAKPWRGELVWTSRDSWGITFPFTRGKPLVKGNLPCLRLIPNALGHLFAIHFSYNVYSVKGSPLWRPIKQISPFYNHKTYINISFEFTNRPSICLK